jgi:2-oxoglutarate ferredoxin oxidoreductase subunit alpha
MVNKLVKNDDISLVIAGEAGQGLEVATDIILKTLKIAEYNVFSCKEYMSRIRGGTNTSEIRISSDEVFSYVEKIDILIALSKNSIKHLEKRISEDTYIIYDDVLKDIIPENLKAHPMPLTSTATNLGGKIFTNTVAAGIIFGMFDVAEEIVTTFIRKDFSGKSEEVINKNIDAVKMGISMGKDFIANNGLAVNIKKNSLVKEKILVTGNDTVSMGFIAGGCDFISSYPMSPSTGVLMYLAQKSEKFNIIVEQAEDEIAAINMGIGAWYAGARAMVTSSGGGFALMVEAVSLAGMTESPMVIHIAQRPGPATGLPTRTEQGDLNLALYAGHGEFPRIILSPGTHEDCFYLAQNAFNLADKYQVPVFVLTDQYILESYNLCSVFDLDKTEVKEFISETDENYQRYKLTEDGISPRGIPGFGKGKVRIDSDEHDEDGHLTENLDLRVKMMDKRLKKLDLIKQDVYEPELIGSQNYKTLLIGWGSTCNTIKEALKVLGRDDIAFLYYKQVYPLAASTIDYLKKAEKAVCIENNATGQFANLICQETGYYISNRILKYDGMPFSVEEAVSKIKELI